MAKHTNEWLKKRGFEGLVAPCGECGCEVGDLAPGIDCEPGKCRPGYKVPCNPETCDAGGDCPWHISQHKPKP